MAPSDLRAQLQSTLTGSYAVGFALAYTALGDTTRAIESLNQAIDKRDGMLAENVFDPILDPLRSDPRFARVKERMGLGPCVDGSATAPPPLRSTARLGGAPQERA